MPVFTNEEGEKMSPITQLNSELNQGLRQTLRDNTKWKQVISDFYKSILIT